MKSLIDRWHRLVGKFSLETRLVTSVMVVVTGAAITWPLEQINWSWKWLTFPMLFLGGFYVRVSVQSALWENTQDIVRKIMNAKSHETLHFRTGYNREITIQFGEREVTKLPDDLDPDDE